MTDKIDTINPNLLDSAQRNVEPPNFQAAQLSLVQPDRKLILNRGENKYRQIAGDSFAGRIRHEFVFSAMALYQYINNKDGYHNLEHTGDTLHFSDWVMYKEELRKAFGIDDELQRYNSLVPEDEQISIFELPGLFGIVWLSHDIGNNGRLDPRLTDVMIDYVKEPDSKLGGFAETANKALQAKVESIRPGYNNSGLVPIQHSEVNAVENSRQIAAYLLTYTISTNIAAGAIEEENGAQLLNRYRKFIDSMISYTEMDVQDESQRIRNGTFRPFERFVKTVDRIASYAGKTDEEVWKRISSLAKEKIKDGEHTSLTRKQLFDFAYNTLQQFYPNEATYIVSKLESQNSRIPRMKNPTEDDQLRRYDWAQIAEF